MVKKYSIDQATLSLGNSQVTLYGDAAKIVEIIAVSAAIILLAAKVAKALQ